MQPRSPAIPWLTASGSGAMGGLQMIPGSAASSLLALPSAGSRTQPDTLTIATVAAEALLSLNIYMELGRRCPAGRVSLAGWSG